MEAIIYAIQMYLDLFFSRFGRFCPVRPGDRKCRYAESFDVEPCEPDKVDSTALTDKLRSIIKDFDFGIEGKLTIIFYTRNFFLIFRLQGS